MHCIKYRNNDKVWKATFRATQSVYSGLVDEDFLQILQTQIEICEQYRYKWFW
jgi:hypothetical protein